MVVDEWDRLSGHVVSAKSIDCFKKRLDEFTDRDDMVEDIFFLDSQELPRVGQPAFCRFLIFLCSYVQVILLCGESEAAM